MPSKAPKTSPKRTIWPNNIKFPKRLILLRQDPLTFFQKKTIRNNKPKTNKTQPPTSHNSGIGKQQKNRSPSAG